MSFVPLSALPWRRAKTATTLPDHWVHSEALAAATDRWRNWLADQQGGAWLLCERDPLTFCSALLALWETGRVAVLSADDRPETLSRIQSSIDGRIPCSPEPTIAKPLPQAPNRLDDQRRALVLFTSGSSGEPLALAKTFQQLDEELRVHAQLWPLDESAGVISQVSHQHIYGLLTGVLHPLCSGRPFCSKDCHFPEVLTQRLAEAGAAQLQVTLVSSPPQLSRLPAHTQWPKPGSLSRILSSGAPLAQEHATHAEQLLNAPVIEIYGSTETGGIAWRRPQSELQWTPLPGVNVRVDDGCLALTSPFLESPHTWWRHPDRVTLTDRGFMLMGREDRLVKVAGKRLSLDQMERVLQSVDGVQAARCVELGRPDGRLGAIIKVTAKAPQDHETRRQLIQQVRTALAAHFETVTLPRYWRFVEELPSNAQGKLDRGLIQRLFNDIDDHKSPRWLAETVTSQDVRLLTLEVPEKLIYLDGHFDQFPLVPGVVLVQWAMLLAQQAFGERPGFQGIDQLKFQRPLRSGMRFTLELSKRENGFGFAYKSDEGQHAGGRIRLAALGSQS
ncbi:MAG: acyl-CoA synthetase [Pseudomonas sp.]|nr:acyl-CoA synthetase [Pseudomonas sp.]